MREVEALGVVGVGGIGKQHAADEGEDRRLHRRMASAGARQGGVDRPPVAVVGARGADVRAIHGEAGHHLAQREAQAVEGEIAGARIVLGEAIEGGGQHVELARHRPFHDQHLALVEDVGEAGALGGEAPVDALQDALVAAIDEQAGAVVEEVVSGGAGNRPGGGQLLVPAEDLLDQEAHRRRGARRAGGALQRRQIAGRIVEAVDVVETHAGHPAGGEQREQAAVRRGEHLGVFHAQTGELVDVEESAVVDLVRGGAPVGEAIRLRLEQRVQADGALRAIEGGDARLDVTRDVGGTRHQARQPVAGDLLLALSLGDPVGLGLGIHWQMAERGEDAAILRQIGGVVARRVEVAVPVEDLRYLARIDRQHVIEIVQREAPVGVGQAQLAALEHEPVLIAEDRQQHLVVQLVLDRPPVDVEAARRGRARPVLEHVAPPGVGARADGHVVRHEVDDQTHAVRAERGGEIVEARRAAEVGADRVVVDDVVAVAAPGARLQGRRDVAVADAEPVQIRHQRARGGEVEVGVQLQAIARRRRTRRAVSRPCSILRRHASRPSPRTCSPPRRWRSASTRCARVPWRRRAARRALNSPRTVAARAALPYGDDSAGSADSRDARSRAHS